MNSKSTCLSNIYNTEAFAGLHDQSLIKKYAGLMTLSSLKDNQVFATKCSQHNQMFIAIHSHPGPCIHLDLSLIHI